MLQSVSLQKEKTDPLKIIVQRKNTFEIKTEEKLETKQTISAKTNTKNWVTKSMKM